MSARTLLVKVSVIFGLLLLTLWSEVDAKRITFVGHGSFTQS